MGRASSFVISLSNAERDELEALLRRHNLQQRYALRIRIVLAAADGATNADIADALSIAPNTVCKWRKRFAEERLDGLRDRARSGRPKVFSTRVVAQAKAIACELPAKAGSGLSRWSATEIAARLVAEGHVGSISGSTVARWLAADALKPWRFRSWIFPRDPDFAAKAGVVLDLYAGIFEGRPLGPGEFVISSDEKTSIQARSRLHPAQPPAPGRVRRVEHEYDRAGALAYLGAWDVHRGRLFGRVEPTTGIRPFGALVDQVMSAFPYATARRVFWVVDNGSSHRGGAAARRLAARWPNLVLVHLPVHASWLNQIEIVFSIIQRKALSPNDFTDTEALAACLRAFEEHFNATAGPFDWRFSRGDLDRLLERLSDYRVPTAA